MNQYTRSFDRRFSIYSADIRAITNEVVVSFWAGDAYRVHADRLIKSVAARGHRYVVLMTDRDSRGWEANCALKPTAILHAMSLLGFRCPVLWLDADAELVDSALNVRDLLGTSDVACCRPEPGKTWPLVNSSLLSGTLAFNTSINARVLLERWRDACVQAILRKELDQEVLRETIDRFPGLTVAPLDPRYVCIPDLMHDVKHPVVVHHQASRDDRCRYG